MALLLVSALAATGHAQTPDTLPQRSVGVLHPGDLLIIKVFGEEEYSGEFLIDNRGFVQIPGVGIFQAAGLDPNLMRDRIRDELSRAGVANPSLSVQPQIRVSVLGEVQEPGLRPVEPGTTLITMLSAVGGPTERANLEKAHVIREGRSYPVNLEHALAGDATGSILLFSNDVLVVPRRSGFTRENMTLFMGAMTALLSLANVIIASRR